MLIVVVEVIVAPIPGVPVYAAGGVALGGWLGGFLGAAANALGAMAACWLSRSIVALRWDPESRLARIIARRGAWTIFALRLNPLTSTDFVSYAAGVAAIPVWQVGLATFFGIAPICFAAAILADQLPPLGVMIAVLSIAYAVIGSVAWFSFSRARPGSDPAPGPGPGTT